MTVSGISAGICPFQAGPGNLIDVRYRRRGGHRRYRREPHLLSALDHATGVAAQRRVAENSNEAPLHGAGAAIAATITASAGRLRRAIESLARIASAKACPPRYDPPDPRAFSKAERRPARFNRSR